MFKLEFSNVSKSIRPANEIVTRALLGIRRKENSSLQGRTERCNATAEVQPLKRLNLARVEAHPVLLVQIN